MIEKVFDLLESKGLDVYFPGQKEGLCESEYIVVKDGGQNHLAGTNKLGYATIDLYIYTPLAKYTRLSSLSKEVKESMKEHSYLKPSGNESPSMIDDKRKAHVKKIEYVTTKKL
ncbi:hypothetical protein [Tepidibacter hydrothermalis]|uniref:Uncharacterized protein n=1 Tax=Tepidibacter hydrothermalis TaxID=3036126 RepID=A0ABY8EJM2_9FIRM|nr:hypothetical protein [Tepidibacter hydrothermalis]WFD12012.1 hypothetical protein P4S50_08015 [Tepidibacter hydrothermalis]